MSAALRLLASAIGSDVIPCSSLKPWNDTSRQMTFFHWSYNKQSLVGSKRGERASLICHASMLKTLLTPHLGFLNIFSLYEGIFFVFFYSVVRISVKTSCRDLGSWRPVWSSLLWNYTLSVLLTAVLMLSVKPQWTFWCKP